MAEHVPAPAEIEHQRRQCGERERAERLLAAPVSSTASASSAAETKTPSTSAMLSCLMLTSAASDSASSHAIIPIGPPEAAEPHERAPQESRRRPA